VKSSRSPIALSAFTLALFLVAGSACVRGLDLPSDCGANAVQRTATLADDQLDPQSIDVCRDQRVTLDLAVAQDGELHLHGYDEEVSEQEFQAGETLHIIFTAVHSGQFTIEVHRANGDEVQVGILTVHEP